MTYEEMTTNELKALYRAKRDRLVTTVGFTKRQRIISTMDCIADVLRIRRAHNAAK